MLSIRCKHCGAKLDAPERLIGRQLPCPKCQGAVTIARPIEIEPTLPEVVVPETPTNPPAKPMSDVASGQSMPSRSVGEDDQDSERQFPSALTVGLVALALTNVVVVVVILTYLLVSWSTSGGGTTDTATLAESSTQADTSALDNELTTGVASAGRTTVAPASLVKDVMANIPVSDRIKAQIQVTMDEPSKEHLQLWEKGHTPATMAADPTPMPGQAAQIQPGILRFEDHNFLQSSLSHDGRHVALWQVMSRNDPGNAGRKPLFCVLDATTGQRLMHTGISGIRAVTFLSDKLIALDMDRRSLHVFDRQNWAYTKSLKLAFDAYSIDTMLDKWLVINQKRSNSGLLYLDAHTLAPTDQTRFASRWSRPQQDQGAGFNLAPGGYLTGGIIWDRDLQKVLDAPQPAVISPFSLNSADSALGFQPEGAPGKRQRNKGGFGADERFLNGAARLANGALVSVKQDGESCELTFSGSSGQSKLELKASRAEKGLPEVLVSNDRVVLHTSDAVFLITPSQLGIEIPSETTEFAGPSVRFDNNWLDNTRTTTLKLVTKNMRQPVRASYKTEYRHFVGGPAELLRTQNDTTLEVDAHRLLESNQLLSSQEMTVLQSQFGMSDDNGGKIDAERFHQWYIESTNRGLKSIGEKPTEDFVISLPIQIDAVDADGQKLQVSQYVHLPVPRKLALKMLKTSIHPTADAGWGKLPKDDEPIFLNPSIAGVSESVRATLPEFRKQLLERSSRAYDNPAMAALGRPIVLRRQAPIRTWHLTKNGVPQTLEGHITVQHDQLSIRQPGEQFGDIFQPSELPEAELAQAILDLQNSATEDPLVRGKFQPSERLHQFQDVIAEKHSGQFARALRDFESVHQCLPPAAIVDSQGKPLLSWRVMLLPYLGFQQLFTMFHLDEPWDSPHNRTLIPLMPAVYMTRDAGLPSGKTRLLALTGRDTGMPPDHLVALNDLVHPLNSRILCVVAESQHAVTWTQPIDFVMTAQGPPLAGWAIERVGDTERFTAITGGGHHVSLEVSPENIAACYWSKQNVNVKMDRQPPAALSGNLEALPAPKGLPLPSFGVTNRLGFVQKENNVYLSEAFDPDRQLIALTGRVEKTLVVYDMTDPQDYKGRGIQLEGVLTHVAFWRANGANYFVVSTSEPNRLWLIDTSSLEVVKTIDQGEVWSSVLRIAQGESSPFVYAVAREGNYESTLRDPHLERWNLLTGKVDKTWPDFRVYGDLTLFRRKGRDYLNHFQMNRHSAVDFVALPKAVNNLEDQPNLSSYAVADEQLIMFPFPDSDVSLWGDGFYTLDMQRLKQRLSFYAATYLEGTAFVGGVMGDEFVFGSVNDGRLITRMTMPTKRPTAQFELKREAQSMDDSKIFYSPKAQAVYLVGRDYISPVPLSELKLPDEPYLLPKVELPNLCTVGKEYRADLRPEKGTYQLKLLEGPQGAQVNGGNITWTPKGKFSGPVRFLVRCTSGEYAHEESWTVSVMSP